MSRRLISIFLTLVMILNLSVTNGALYANENNNQNDSETITQSQDLEEDFNEIETTKLEQIEQLQSNDEEIEDIEDNENIDENDNSVFNEEDNNLDNYEPEFDEVEEIDIDNYEAENDISEAGIDNTGIENGIKGIDNNNNDQENISNDIGIINIEQENISEEQIDNNILINSDQEEISVNNNFTSDNINVESSNNEQTTTANQTNEESSDIIETNSSEINTNNNSTSNDEMIESTNLIANNDVIISTNSEIIEEEMLLSKSPVFGNGNNNYTIKFDYYYNEFKDKSTPPEITIKDDSTANLPSKQDVKNKDIPEGYELAWWTYAKKRYGQKNYDGTNYVIKNISDIPTNQIDNGSITLKAVWNVQITYDLNGRGNISPNTQYIQQYLKPENDKDYDDYYKNTVISKLETLNNIDIEGYKFKGWSFDARATEAVFKLNDNNKIEVNGNSEAYVDFSIPKTLYAVWEEQKYKVVLHVNSGMIDDEKIKQIDSDVEWKTTEGVSDRSYDRPYSKELLLPTKDNITKKGHTFLGWYTNGNFYGNIVSKVEKNTTGTHEYHAKWEANTYSIDYVLNGGSFKNEADVKKSIKYTEQYPLPVGNDLVKQGYTFSGWFNNSECIEDTGEDKRNKKVTSITENNEDYNHIYYAKWEIQEYNIKYYTYGNNTQIEFQASGSDGNSPKWKSGFVPKGSRYIGDVVTLPTVDDIDVYNAGSETDPSFKIFKGWKYDNEQSDNYDFIKYIPADAIPKSGNEHKLIAQWYDAYKVTLQYSDSDSDSDDIYVITENTIDKQYEFPTKPNSEFIVWKKGEDDFDFKTHITSNITLKATWDDNITTYKVEFKIKTLDGNNPDTVIPAEIPNQYVVQDEKVRKPDKNPSAIGYEFLGWYLDSPCTQAFDFDNFTIKAPQTIYAKWKKLKYKIKYELNNGEWNNYSNPPEEYTVENRANITLPTVNSANNIENLKRYHYIFDGWYLRADCTGKKIENLSDDDYAEDLILYAKWIFQPPTETGVYYKSINFVPNGASGYMDTQYIISNETDNKLNKNTFTKTDYEFLSWSSSDGKTWTDEQQINYADITDNLILTANWKQKPKNYTPSYNRNSGSSYWGSSGSSSSGGGGGGVRYSPSMNLPTTIYNNQISLSPNVTTTQPPAYIGFNENAQKKINNIKIVSGVVDGRTSNWVVNNQTGKWQLYNKDGFKATNGFYLMNNVTKIGNYQKITADTYYFDYLGQMVTGWVQTADSKWYYFETAKTANEGKMITGWKEIDGDYYYFNNDGSMVVNGFTPDGRRVGADGKLLKLNM